MKDIVERLRQESGGVIKILDDAALVIESLRGDIAEREAEITVLQTQLTHATAKIRDAHARPGFDCPCRYCRS